jgi:hypothetical protein
MNEWMNGWMDGWMKSGSGNSGPKPINVGVPKGYAMGAIWARYWLGAMGYRDHMSYRLLDIRIAYIMAIGNWLHGYMVMGIGCMVIGYGN